MSSGAELNPNVAVDYDFGIHCGARILGFFNDVWWRADEATEGQDWMPIEWTVDPDRPDGPISVELVLAEDRSSINATYQDHTVVYLPGGELADDEPCA